MQLFSHLQEKNKINTNKCTFNENSGVSYRFASATKLHEIIIISIGQS